jgi:hypothetical protein
MSGGKSLKRRFIGSLQRCSPPCGKDNFSTRDAIPFPIF